MMTKFTPKKVTLLIILAVAIVFTLGLAGALIETVEKGTYQVKQAAITGNMSAKLTPGVWLQLFGDITMWPKAETFFFTHDLEEGEAKDQSIEVRFNDGSLCDISGTLRIIMPSTEDGAIGLITVKGYKTFHDLEEKLVKPVVRNALRMTANLMNARESYHEKRSDFIFGAWDQIQNGLYETYEVVDMVEDPITGKKEYRNVKKIKRDGSGNPIYQQNPLEGLGLTLANFEVKSFEYDDAVKKQIATQQEALMAVATAKANSEKARQEAKTAEEQGKKAVVEAQYQKEEEKIRAVVDAQKDKEVAELNASQRLEVAKLDKQAAKEEKERQILLGEGESERKRLVLDADGALAQKLDAYQKVQSIWANAYANRKVPSVIMGGGGNVPGSDGDVLNMSDTINLMLLDRMGLDLDMRKGTTD